MKIVVKKDFDKFRLDKFLLVSMPDRTRAFLQKLIKEGYVKVFNAGETVVANKAGLVLRAGSIVEVSVPEAKMIEAKAQDIKLKILFEDSEIIVIDKPAKMVVHPSETGGHTEGTIVNALLHHCGKSLTGISGELRPGIVHRLDKDTSGVLIVAKTDDAMQSLMKQFSERRVEKKYIVLVRGEVVPNKAVIDSPIGRSLRDRKKMSIQDRGRNAITEYEVSKVFKTGTGNLMEYYSLLDVNLKTGRTHQIRVHMTAIGHPVVGDIVYGDPKVNKKFQEKFGLCRQFLHAAKLTIIHPKTGKKISFESKLPKDIKFVVDSLKK